MKAIYFEEPVDQFSCVERAWRAQLEEGEGRAIFLRSRPGDWASTGRSWSIKYVLQGRVAFEINGQWCEVFEGFCFVIPENCSYRSTLRDGKTLTVFGRPLVNAGPEPDPGISGVFALDEAERRSLRSRLEDLQQFRQSPGGMGPEQGVEVDVQARFPLPENWQALRSSMAGWMSGSDSRLRSAARLLQARHFLTAGYREHDICSRAAEIANMTRSHFSRQFSALFSESPRQYLVAYRSAVARSLLRSGRHSVEEVSALLGYGHSSSLAHLFQRQSLRNPRRHMAALSGDGSR